MGNFQEFLVTHPLYESIYTELWANSRLLATSGEFVFLNHGEDLGPISDDILRFVTNAYPASYLQDYIVRHNYLVKLQRRFNKNPSPETLGDTNGKVTGEAYRLSLLLSIVFTNHRFEIFVELKRFLLQLRFLGSGRNIVSIGAGTGYELKLASELLPGWNIQGYDTDVEMRAKAEQLLEFFGCAQKIDIGNLFPLDVCTPEVKNYYDAIILCEVLEHLTTPDRALRTLRDCLSDDGQMFVTMAINIAQEDHVYLYRDVESCRRQILASGLRICREWIAPATIFAIPKNREEDFTRGNYIAVVERWPGPLGR